MGKNKLVKKCQKEPKFGFPRRHVAEPGKAGRSVVTSIYISEGMHAYRKMVMMTSEK